MSNSTAQQEQNVTSPLFLGLDLSTQQLKVIALQASSSHDATQESTSLETHSSFTVQFDADLPHYKTQGGVSVQNRGEHHDSASSDKGVVTTPVLMWIEALQLVLDRMKEAQFPFERVQAISGAAQQHGSVYWSKGAQDAFCAMESDPSTTGHHSPHTSLAELFKHAFTVLESPIWQDTSTTAQCDEIEEYLGRTDQHGRAFDVGEERDKATIQIKGRQRLAELTGSRAYERYTGSQILKLVQKQPEIYRATERISLVSSFLESLLIAQYGMIDAADGSGMNLLNIETKIWEPVLTRFIGQGGGGKSSENCGSADDEDNKDTLVNKLGPVDASGRAVQGVLSRWFRRRYGFRDDVAVVTFTGDNPATVMAMRAEPGDAIVSLGTSDTLLLYTDSYAWSSDKGQHHSNSDGKTAKEKNARILSIGYLCHPVDSDGYLMLYCAKNGSLAREKVRDQYANGDWDQFNHYLLEGRTGKDHEHTPDDDEQGSRVGFYFFDREIWPPVQGVYRFENGRSIEEFRAKDKQRANIRAICESQFLAMRARSSQLHASLSETSASLSPPGISRILATGGASSNTAILQLLSNIFGVPVVSTSANQEKQKGAGSAAWGAARKAYLYGRPSSSSRGTDDDHGHGNRTGDKVTIEPNLDETKKYVELIPELVRLEGTLL
ncbi:hypothetical protein EDD11_009550 [Mortierella claussenii]|nr:hypothetical protein EDD11_009550 [Mortierella claussenii]